MKNKLMVLMMAATFAISGSVFADEKKDKNPCGNSGNNCNIGGNGGNGGNGVGVGVGIGLGVAGAKATNSTSVDVVNKQAQGQLQGQQQGIFGSGNSSVKNSGNSFNVNSNKATGGSVSNSGNSTTYVQIGGAGENGEGGELARSEVNIQMNETREVAAPAPSQIEIKTPGTASVPNIYPTSPCMNTTSTNISWMGGAFSGGTSWKDDDCGIRETARLFYGHGKTEDGDAVMCSSDYAKVAPTCQKLSAKKAALEDQSRRIAELEKQLAARESTRTSEGDKRKTDATIRSSVEGKSVKVAAGNCSVPATTETAGWSFDVNKCEWVAK